MKKEINITTSVNLFFRQWLETVKIFKPFSELRPKELDVFAELLKHNYLLKDIPETHRWKLVFDYDTKLKMKEYLKMKDETFQNILSALRGKKLIVENTIPKQYCIYPDDDNTLTFRYKLNGDHTKENKTVNKQTSSEV